MPKMENSTAISIIGAGKVGSTLALLLHRAGYRIVSVISRRKSSAKKLARLVGCRNYSDSISDIAPAAGIIQIAAPDDELSTIAEELAGCPSLDFSAVAAFHTSGSLTSDELLPLKRKEATTFSLHPIQTFSKSSTLSRQAAMMKNGFYGFEGPSAGLKIARRLVRALNGSLVRIPKEEKILYHIACVFASNYLTSLLGTVEDLAVRVGGDLRLSHFKPLVRTSMENAFLQSPAMALTGPVARGSSRIVELHLDVLQKTDKQIAELYRQIGLKSLSLAAAGKSLSPHAVKKLKRMLESHRSEK
ncbi:MAG: DUF2520 domain-containing protein [Ignavibacteriae bacterium]|nr:MAG: DUF2520 domain-containing protein [Ignavibacteriota bacterium]